MMMKHLDSLDVELLAVVPNIIKLLPEDTALPAFMKHIRLLPNKSFKRFCILHTARKYAATKFGIKSNKVINSNIIILAVILTAETV
jgi:hypothetical protein